jgi:hypothetical protein
VDTLIEAIIDGGQDFWTTVHAAFMERELNRAQMKTLLRGGLNRAGGSYRRLLELMRLPSSDYQRFMDFLRHHDLKP